MLYSSPKTYRETIGLFSKYVDASGIPSINSCVNWNGATPHSLYNAVLRRLPDSRTASISRRPYIPEDHFVDLVASNEFRQNIIQNILEEFSEKKRIIYVHIPKCGGSDINFHMFKRHPSLTHDLLNKAIVSDSRLFNAIRSFYLDLILSDSIYVTGHAPLKWYLDRNLLRGRAECFTIVRNPMDSVISMVNYTTNRILDENYANDINNVNWLAAIGLNRAPAINSDNDKIEIARKILRCKSIVVPNIMCNYLGTGTCNSALDYLAMTNISIVDLNDVDKWKMTVMPDLKSENTKTNKSESIINKSNLMVDDLSYIEEITIEDRNFYKIIFNHRSNYNTIQIKGISLVT